MRRGKKNPTDGTKMFAKGISDKEHLIAEDVKNTSHNEVNNLKETGRQSELIFQQRKSLRYFPT